MEVVELIIYILLVFVLLSLIGIMGWLLYDYSNLKTKISGDFQTINNTFSSHRTKDNTLEDNINSNSSNILNTSNYVNLNALNTSNYVNLNALNTSNYVNLNALNTSNYVGIVEDRVDEHDKNLSTFHNNLNKYFTFGTNNQDINGADKKIYNYIFDGDLTEKDKRLELMYETVIKQDMTVNGDVIANKDVKLKTDKTNNLKICNNSDDSKTIGSCFNIYKDGDNLIIKPPSKKGKIIIGDSDEANSLVIEPPGDNTVTNPGSLKFKNNII